MHVDFSSYRLSKWARLAKVREQKICFLTDNKYEARLLHGHHIFPKHDYPELAYNMCNCILLNSRIHIRTVHSSKRNERMYRLLFWSYLNRPSVKLYNKRAQQKLGAWKYMPGPQTIMDLDISKGWKRLMLSVYEV